MTSKHQKENDILLIVDEVQTEIDRTETLLCCNTNIITLAKGLKAGLSIGEILMNDKTSNIF